MAKGRSKWRQRLTSLAFVSKWRMFIFFSQPLTSNGRDLARKRKEQVKHLLSMRLAKFGRTNPFAGFYSDIEFTGKLSMMPRRPILFKLLGKGPDQE